MNALGEVFFYLWYVDLSTDLLACFIISLHPETFYLTLGHAFHAFIPPGLNVNVMCI